MDIQEEKLDLIKWLTEIDDDHIVRQLSIIKNSSAKGRLTHDEKKAIDKGLQDIREGKVKSHEETMELTRKKYSRLF